MREIKAAICDDEALSREMTSSALETCFRSRGCVLRLDRYASPLALKKRAGEGYDIVFLDIDMPEMDGIRLAAYIKDVSEKTEIIFVSNCEDRVFESLSVHPFGFVRKSSFLKDVESVVNLYIASQNTVRDAPSIEVRTRDSVSRVRIDRIMYIECEKNVQRLHLHRSQETPCVRTAMNALEEELKGYGFLRVHQGYLANYVYIEKIDADTVFLTDGTRLPVSRRNRKEVFLQYMRLSRLDDSVVKPGKD